MTEDEEGPEPGPRRTARVAMVSLALVALFGSGLWRVTGGAADPEPGVPDQVGRSALAPGAMTLAAPGGQDATGARPRYDRLTAVDWTAVRYPLGCRRPAVRVQAAEFADVTGDREPDATVLVRCIDGSGDGGSEAAGRTPTGLYVYESGEAGRPRLLAVLLRPAEGVVATRVKVRAGGIKATGFRYSSPAVPRCCPDETVETGWRWNGAGFTRVG